VARQKMERTIPFRLPIDESLDIGSDTLTGVNDEDYKPPFTFTGNLNKVTLSIDRPKLTPTTSRNWRRRRKQRQLRSSLLGRADAVRGEPIGRLPSRRRRLASFTLPE